MLSPVRGVGEGLVAALMLTHVGLLPGVGPEVGLEVLQARVRFRTTLKLQTDRETGSMSALLLHGWLETSF